MKADETKRKREILLGINPCIYGLNYHDPAVVVLIDGRVVFGVEEERCNRVKHSKGVFPSLALAECLTYCNLTWDDIDNGFTGTTMTRPAFTEMWEDIKAGIIKAVVVRDLSRYSRNYIETGTHLERIFPQYDLRFISVKEDFDNFTVDGTAESLMIPLQSLINDFYSRDISRKVEAAIHTQMEEGTFAWRMLPYGYRWNEDHTGIVPYEPEAKYVRKVFQWKLEGKSVLKISDLLDEEGAPFYRDGAFNKEGIWQHGSLFGMLTNPAYVGDRVYGIRHSAIYKGIKLEKRPEEEWYVIPNDHPPIIDRDTFYAVKEIMKKDSDKRAESMKKTAKEREKLIDLFRGKIFCKDCGGKMYFHRHQMDCKDHYWYADYECSTYVPKRERSAHITESDRMTFMKRFWLISFKSLIKKYSSSEYKLKSKRSFLFFRLS